MKIFILLDVPHLEQAGGAEVHAYRLAKTLNEHGCEIKIIVPLPGAWSSRQETIRGVPTFFLPVPIIKWRRFFWFLYSCEIFFYLLINSNSCVVHLQGLKAFRPALLMKLLTRRPVTIKILSKEHWKIFFEPKKNNIISKVFLDKIDYFIAPSLEIEKYLRDNGLSPKKIIYIPNGTSISSSSDPKKSLRVKLGMPVDKRIATFAGVLYPHKNIPLLLKAWKDVIHKNNNAYLILLGDGPQRSMLHDLIHENNLQDSIVLRGYIPDTTEHLLASDIFILPSRFEGCSNALLEAMSNQCACIASNYQWNSEIIQHNVNGLLFQPDDVQMLALNINKLMNDPALCESLGKAAKETIKNKFSLEDTANMYYNLFSSIKK